MSTATASRFSRLIVAALAALTLAGCTSATPVLSPSPGKPVWPSDTSYGRLFAQVQADGTVTKEVALQAFSTAIAPLPGVPAPQGGAPQDFERADGSFAIDWLMPYIDQLTPDQKAAVDAALKPSPTARLVEAARPVADVGGGFGPRVAPDDPAQPYTDGIAYALSEIPKRLGRALKAKVMFDFADAPPADQPKALAYAFPSKIGTGADCEVRATPNIAGASDERIKTAMAHEVFHCFQLEVRPGGVASDWIIEGQAEWAGEDIAGPGPDGLAWWLIYVDSPNFSLFKRDYDALGFYEHLQETGTNPWTVFDAMLKNPADDVAAFKAAHADSASFLSTWASGYRRTDPQPSTWYAQGRWPTAEHTDPDRLHIANGVPEKIEAASVTNTLYLVKSTADITEISVEGNTRMLTGSVDVPDVQQIDVCTKGPTMAACDCPKGFDYTGPILYTASDGTIWLGVTGGLSGASGTVTGRELMQFCQPHPSGHPEPRGGPDPCAKGCGQSIGDPHLGTIDQQEYDFQAAGEYVLLRSPDGSIEMQGRQVPYPDIPDVSITTALAWKVGGHRVAMYAQGDESGYSLTLDGNQLDPLTLGTMDLGGGAALTALDDGVEVAYGDGTIAQAVFHGNGFAHALDILVAPSDAFRAQAAGLLASIAAGSELPALPDGSALPLSQDRSTRFAQRYQQLAAAWHVTDQTSLFDYQSGQTTATFDVPNFPTQDVAFTVDELEQQQGVQGVAAFQQATEQCAAVGGDQQALLHCVFDIMATKDPAYAQFYALVQQYLANGPTVLQGPVIEVTMPPPPTPSTSLPAGFVQVASNVSLIKGATIGPNGMLYASLMKPDFTAQLVSVDTTTGTPGPSLATTGSGGLFLLDGSLWAGEDDMTGFGKCTLERFDPQTLASQVKIPVGCGIVGPQAVPVPDGVWWLDRSTSDADGHGAMIRHIDAATNAVDRSVELPFVNGYLGRSSTTVFFGDSGPDTGWFRLLPGATSFVPLPLTAQVFGFEPQGEGVWFQPVQNAGALSEADYITGSATPDKVIQIDGILAGADDQAIYVDSSGSNPDALMRYAFDGSAPTTTLSGATLTTANGDHDLGYFDNDPLVIANQKIAKLWLVNDWPATGTTSVIAQATTLP